LENKLNHKIQRLLPPGFSAFLILWGGQLLSGVGSRLSEFALGVWVYQQTHSTTQFSLVYLSLFVPELIVSPFSGILVDRYDRRSLMMGSTLGAGLSTLTIAMLLTMGRLDVWGICMILVFRSLFTTLHFQAYTTIPSLLISPEHLSRTSGLVQLSRATAEILGPMLAGILLTMIQIQGIVWMDAMSFIIAIGSLLIVKLPQNQNHSDHNQPCNSIWQDLNLGWHYITQHIALLSLMIFYLIPQFTLGILWVLFPPLVLSFSSSVQLGFVMSTGGIGWLVGSLYMSVYGGPKSKILAIWICGVAQGLFLLMGGLQPSLGLAAIGISGYMFTYAISISCYHTLWQSLVHLNLQGRVFGVRSLIEQVPWIIAFMMAGPLADRLFEPAMAENGWLAGSMGQLIGVGAGRGIGLGFLLLGLSNSLAALLMWRYAPTQMLTLNPNLNPKD
jgi:MFS transporter, DHA3 family, macrolide efflux protein